MRFGRTLLFWLLIFISLAIVVFFVMRGVLINSAIVQLRSSLDVVHKTQAQSGYFDACQRKGAQMVDSEPFVRYQLRFISDSQYVTEAICYGFEFNPIQIEEHHLPKYVTKLAGGSGFFVGPSVGPSSFTLEAFAQPLSQLRQILGSQGMLVDKLLLRRTLLYEDMRLAFVATETEPISGPVTTCEGYGYYCCEPASQLGQGQQLTGTRSCPDSCFANCLERPVVLSFTSNPRADTSTRVLRVAPNTTVQFQFVASGDQDSLIKGQIEFGDGSVETGILSEQPVSHVFACSTAVCRYEVQLSLVDRRGVVSQANNLSTLQVEVGNEVIP